MDYVLYDNHNIRIIKEENSNYIYFLDVITCCYERINITDRDNINEFLEYLENKYCEGLSDEISHLIYRIRAIGGIE